LDPSRQRGDWLADGAVFGVDPRHDIHEDRPRNLPVDPVAIRVVEKTVRRIDQTYRVRSSRELWNRDRLNDAEGDHRQTLRP
jgi:hypothetical protein